MTHHEQVNSVQTRNETAAIKSRLQAPGSSGSGMTRAKTTCWKNSYTSSFAGRTPSQNPRFQGFSALFTVLDSGFQRRVCPACGLSSGSAQSLRRFHLLIISGPSIAEVCTLSVFRNPSWPAGIHRPQPGLASSAGLCTLDSQPCIEMPRLPDVSTLWASPKKVDTRKLV